MASNDGNIQDDTGAFEDWLEIYNPGPEGVDLGGLFLTDDLGDTTKWALPSVVLAAEGYLLVWCDSEPGDGPLHADFKLGASGEEIGLFDRVEHGNSVIDSYVFGLQTTDVSEGRSTDGGLPWVFFAAPTPGAENIFDPAAVNDTPTASGIRFCYPNPFNPSVTIEYSLASKRRASLAIYDLRGRVVRSLVSGVLQPGRHTARWDGLGSDGDVLPSGVYFARLSHDGFAQTQKLLLLK